MKEKRYSKRVEKRRQLADRWGRLTRHVILGVVLSATLGVIGLTIVGIATSQWDGKRRFTVMVATPQLALFSYQPRAQEGHLIAIDDRFVFMTAYGYGRWQARALSGLDMQEDLGGSLLRDTGTRAFGVVVDGHISVRGGEARTVETREDLAKLITTTLWRRYIGSIETNLSTWDLVRLLRLVTTVRPDKIKEIRLIEALPVRELTEPDNAKAYEVDDVALNEISRQWFTDEGIAKEEVTVAVINNTRVGGLGATVARILATSGIRVVAVENGSEEVEVTKMYVHETQKQSETLTFLTRLMPEAEVATLGDEARANIIVSLGKDMGKRFGGSE